MPEPLPLRLQAKSMAKGWGLASWGIAAAYSSTCRDAVENYSGGFKGDTCSSGSVSSDELPKERFVWWSMASTVGRIVTVWNRRVREGVETPEGRSLLPVDLTVTLAGS